MLDDLKSVGVIVNVDPAFRMLAKGGIGRPRGASAFSSLKTPKALL
jgi:hypothetical protein